MRRQHTDFLEFIIKLEMKQTDSTSGPGPTPVYRLPLYSHPDSTSPHSSNTTCCFLFPCFCECYSDHLKCPPHACCQGFLLGALPSAPLLHHATVTVTGDIPSTCTLTPRSSLCPGKLEVTSCLSARQRDFVDVIKWRILKWGGYPILSR